MKLKKMQYKTYGSLLTHISLLFSIKLKLLQTVWKALKSVINGVKLVDHKGLMNSTLSIIKVSVELSLSIIIWLVMTIDYEGPSENIDKSLLWTKASLTSFQTTLILGKILWSSTFYFSINKQTSPSKYTPRCLIIWLLPWYMVTLQLHSIDTYLF